MQLTVKDVLSLLKENQVKLIAGRGGLKNIVFSANIMDSPDIRNWARKGDIVLTTGYIAKDSPALMLDIVKDLHAMGIAALGIKTKRFMSDLSEEIMAFADEQGFPVFEIPNSVSLADIMNYIVSVTNQRSYEQNLQKRSLFQILLNENISESDLGQVFLMAPNLRNQYFYECWLIHVDMATPLELTRITELVQSFLAANKPLSMVAEKSGRILVLAISVTDFQYTSHPAPLLYAFLKKHYTRLPITLDIGISVQSLKSVYKSYRTARGSHRINRSLDRTNCVSFPYESLPYLMLHNSPEAESLLKVHGQVFEKLEKEDPELLKTLEAYLENQQRLRETADALFIHRNTLSNRIEKIQTLTGLDFENHELMFSIRLAFRTFRILHTRSEEGY